MTLEKVVAILGFTAFAICSVLFISRICSARNFKTQIAYPRNFTEGSDFGAAFPIWILIYGILFIQSTALLVFPTSGEIALNRRIIVFLFSLILFFVFRANTLPLLGVWFGRTGIWISHGTGGLIKFEELMYFEIQGRKALRDYTPTEVCTVIFRAKGRQLFFRKRKYSCRLAFGELLPYLDKLPIDSNGRFVAKQKKNRFDSLAPALSRILSALIAFSGICFILSTSLLSPYSYTEDASAVTDEIQTFSPISEAFGADGLIIVRYKNIEGINVYSEENGQFLWSLSRQKLFFPNSGDGLSVSQGVLRYTVGGVDRYFSITDGTELSDDQVTDIEFPKTNAIRDMDFEFHPLYIRKQLSDSSYRYIVSRPSVYTLFIPTFAWWLLVVSLICLYIIRSITALHVYNKEKRLTAQTKIPNGPNEDPMDDDIDTESYDDDTI